MKIIDILSEEDMRDTSQQHPPPPTADDQPEIDRDANVWHDVRASRSVRRALFDCGGGTETNQAAILGSLPCVHEDAEGRAEWQRLAALRVRVRVPV